MADEIGLQRAPEERQPFLHVSGMFPPERGCMALMLPLAQHPTNKNEIIAWDLSADPGELFDLDADTIRTRLFTRTEDLPEDMERLPIKNIHLNRSPIVISDLRTLPPAVAARWGMDVDTAFRHAARAVAMPEADKKMRRIWSEVYQRESGDVVDVDEDLYGGFVGNADRRQLNRVRALSPEALATTRFSFDDARLDELLLRYRARNFPETLNAEEKQVWSEHCARQLSHRDNWLQTLTSLRQTLAPDEREHQGRILDALQAYAQTL